MNVKVAWVDCDPHLRGGLQIRTADNYAHGGKWTHGLKVTHTSTVVWYLDLTLYLGPNRLLSTTGL